MHRRTVGAAVVSAGLGGCLTRGSAGSDAEAEFSQSAVAPLFHDRYNAVRADHDRQQVERRDALSAMGQAHAANMATHEYVGHVEPDGTTIEDRFRERGLDCRLPIPGSDRYYPGAENAAGAREGRVTHPNTDKTFTIATADDLARYLLDTWLQSPPHRKVMLLPAVSAIGLGVAQSGDDIYAALEFC